MAEEKRPFCLSDLTPSESELLRELIRSRIGTILGPESAARLNAVERGNGSGTGKKPKALKKQDAIMRTPGRPNASSSSSIQRIFGRPLRDLSMVLVQLDEDNEELLVPKFLEFLVKWLQDEDRLAVKGVFREGGSAARQKALRSAVEASENWRDAFQGAFVHDVASVLKQWLRELPEPLIPNNLHRRFAESWKVDDEEKRREAIQLCCALLPAKHAATLAFIVRFFASVAQREAENKMGVDNLAKVLMPNFFSLGSVEADMSCFTEIVEELIKNSADIGRLSSHVSESMKEAMLTLPLTTTASEDNLDTDTDSAIGGVGPSERRRKKKKRRSGSVSRIFTGPLRGIQKAMSRSATPVAPSRSDYYADLNFTPLPSRKAPSDARFTSPRMPAKRRAYAEHELSPNSKQQKQLGETPQQNVRGRARSFSLKTKFKRKKSLKDGNNVEIVAALNNISPLPSKPSINLTLATPATPASVDFPQGCDISDDDEVQFNNSNKNLDECDASVSSALENAAVATANAVAAVRRSRMRQSLSPEPSSTSGRSRKSRKSRSPSERKIGASRGANIRKAALLDTADVKQRFRKNSSAKSSPKNDSLTNLRADISSVIEQSFGPVDVDDEITFAEPRPVHRGFATRRQSSAFELSRPTKTSSTLRRQSSAFEIAARNRQLHPTLAEEAPQRGVATRSSLRRKNSSVKDLVKKLEMGSLKQPKTPPPPKSPPKCQIEDEEFQDEFKDDFKEEWVDATEFFKNPNTVLPRRLLDEDLGSKRSSIIRIRQQNRGRVLQSVQTLNGPFHGKMPPPPSPMATVTRTPLMIATTPTPRRMTTTTKAPSMATTPTPRRMTTMSKAPTPSNAAVTRRLSARMGVAKPASVQSQQLQNRRQTPSGIRTSVNYKKTPTKSATTPTPKPKTTTPTPTLSSSTKRSKKLPRDSRRHLTIAYPGERVRSPLRERQNVTATVQRSKSAQTPLQNKKPTVTVKQTRPTHEEHPMVRRSHSLKSPSIFIDENGRMKSRVDVIVDNTKRTPVKRRGSERSAVKVTVNSMHVRSPRIF